MLLLAPTQILAKKKIQIKEQEEEYFIEANLVSYIERKRYNVQFKKEEKLEPINKKITKNEPRRLYSYIINSKFITYALA